MTIFGKFKIHPTAALFPLAEGDEFAKLVADIKANGLIEPIVLSFDGTVILDGRNRYLACEKADVDRVYIKLGSHYTEHDLILFIVSKNMHRRHLDAGQRAMIGLRLVDALSEAAKERQREHGGTAPGKKSLIPKSGEVIAPRVVDQIAAMVGVSHSTVSQAKKISETSSNLANAVMAGSISLNDAYRQIRQKENDNPQKTQLSNTMVQLKTHLGSVVAYPLPKSKATFNVTNGHVSWAHFTWNPVTGCLHGCKYCYARELAMRPSFKASYPVGFEPLFHHERLDAPANTKIPDGDDPVLRRVFVCSMADLYGKWVPQEWIDEVHASCIENQQWEYLMLTKFPRRYVDSQLPPTSWLGTSVDEQKRVKLAEDAFRQISGVRVKWLSLEPLLAPLVFSDLSMFDWVVIGSQTETEQPDGIVPAFAPPFEWVARITAQAIEAGCKVWQKPNLLGVTGPQAPGMKLIQQVPITPENQVKQGSLWGAKNV